MIPGWQMEGYHKLRTAVVQLAVDDYRKALKKSQKIGEVCAEQTKLEKWFLSQWGQLLSGDNGELIIEKCRASCKSIPNTKSRQLLADDIQQKIYQEYRDGVRYNAILQKYKIKPSTLYNIVRRWEK